MGKKVILADTFGELLAFINKNAILTGVDTPTAWGFAFLYMLEIYYDFSGYSDIAIGLAALFGYDIKENFDFPYRATSITEFWRRWHISLGTWFKEYVYLPLGGNRKGLRRTLFNLGIVFLLTGIWHGSTLGYLFWGVMHGSCVLMERYIKDNSIYRRIPNAIKWSLTMFVVMIGWLFFYFGTFEKTVAFIKIMFAQKVFTRIPFTYVYYFNNKILVMAVIGFVGAVLLNSNILEFLKDRVQNSKILFTVKEFLLVLLFIIVLVCVVNSRYSPFIYFQY